MRHRFLAWAASTVWVAAAFGQGFPTKAVRVIVPYPAGGTTDIVARLVLEKASARWGQPAVVENRGGAAGNIGAEAVSRAEPDGYTLLVAAPGPLAVNDSLYRKLAYDPEKFVAVSVLASMPNVLALRPGFPAQSVQELVALARANPEKIAYASQGSGSTSHLTTSLFQSVAEVKLLHIPYKGTAPALADLMGGQVDLMFDNITSSLAPARAGKIRILAVASAQRLPMLPDAPTLIESGYPGFESGTWVAVAAPPGTPAALAAQIAEALSEAVRNPDVQRKLADLSALPIGNAPAEASAFIAAERARWRRVIRAANVTLE